METREITIKELDGLLSSIIKDDSMFVLYLDDNNRDEIERIVDKNWDRFFDVSIPKRDKQKELWLNIKKERFDRKVSWIGWMPPTNEGILWYEKNYSPLIKLIITTSSKKEFTEDIIEMMLM